MTEKPPKGSYTIKYVCNILYDVMCPKITSKTCQTGNTDHDCHKLKIEHDIIDQPVKPVHNLLVRLNLNMTSSYNAWSRQWAVTSSSLIYAPAY